MTQRDRILSLLKAGRCLSALDALRLAGTNRLAARIHELRQSGHPIVTRLVSVRGRYGRARIAVYTMRQA